MPLDAIAPQHVRGCMKKRGQQEKARVNREKALLLHLFNKASEWGYKCKDDCSEPMATAPMKVAAVWHFAEHAAILRHPRETQVATDHQRILILCKTYPSPSARYVETSCVAGMAEDGRLVRLFPVPFRLVEDDQQFKKWQWVTARVRRAQDDARPESHRVSVDTIQLEGEPLSTRDHWIARREVIKGVPVFDSFGALDTARETDGVTLGLVRPGRLLGLDITPVDNPDWTEDEKAKLLQEQQQGNLFDADEDQRTLKTLKKLPFDFHYRYECQTEAGLVEYRHKLVDWEAGGLYWKVCHREDWQAAFRHKFVTEFADKDVLFLMGTIHRFPKQWLIVSVLYPPKLPDALARQQSLF